MHSSAVWLWDSYSGKMSPSPREAVTDPIQRLVGGILLCNSYQFLEKVCRYMDNSKLANFCVRDKAVYMGIVNSSKSTCHMLICVMYNNLEKVFKSCRVREALS